MEQQKLDMPISAKNLITYALPTIVTLLFFSVYMMVGGVFVARLVNTNALSAMNIIMPVSNVPCAIGMMLASGGSAIVARKMGEGRGEEAKALFTFLFLVAVAIGAILGVLGLAFLDPILAFLGGSDPAVYDYCVEFAIPTFCLFPFGVIAMLMLVFVITAGKAAMGTFLALLGGIGTIALDYLLIGVLDMGLTGAAIATGAGYALPSILGFFLFLFNRKGTLHWVKPSLDWKALWQSCLNGSSEMVTNLSLSVITLLFNLVLMNLAGADGVAAITIILYAQGLLNSAYMGYATGIAPIISYNYGKQDHDRLKEIYRISLKAVLGSSAIVMLASLVLAEPIVSVFSEEGSAVYEMTIHGFRIFSACFLFMGLNIFGSSMFTALGNGKVSAIISFMRSFVLTAACILLLPQIFGLNGVWLAVPLAELLGTAITLCCFRKYKTVYQYA